MSQPCPTCERVHGKGGGGYLRPSGEYPSLLQCTWCGRHYRSATALAVPVFVSQSELHQYVKRTSPVCAIGRVPTEDEKRGIAWWNALSESERLHWLNQASADGIASAAQAWVAYKGSVP